MPFTWPVSPVALLLMIRPSIQPSLASKPA